MVSITPVYGPGRLVVGQDRAELDVLGLEQVEDDAVVGLGLAGEVQVRVARVVAERGHRQRALELEIHRESSDRRRPRCSSLPGRYSNPFQASTRTAARGDVDLDLAGRVEEPAEVADGCLALAVPLAGLGPLAGQAVGRERIGRRLVEVAVGPDDVEPAGRRPARGAVADGDPEPGGVLARRPSSPRPAG